MSRIHEALKKAAQERSQQKPSGEVTDLLDIATDVHRPAAAVEAVVEQNLDGQHLPQENQFIRFEDLVKRCASPKWHLHSNMSVFTGTDNGRVGAERFRTLRSRLNQIAATRQLRKLVITSSLPAEGKTFVAANLAQSFVRQPDQRVLLIDADLRASRLHLALGAPGRPGLTDYLRGEADEFAVIQRGLEGNLFFIPGGSEVSNPSELLLNDRMKRLLDLFTPVFDWIIMDSPPALPVHDASMLADLCDGVLFVVRAGSTNHELAEKASLEFQNKNLLGVVLNRVDKEDAYGSYYYGYPSPGEKLKE